MPIVGNLLMTAGLVGALSVAVTVSFLVAVVVAIRDQCCGWCDD